jgi:hypothetical protein
MIEYFDSRMPMYSINNNSWTNLHRDDKEFIVAANFDSFDEVEKHYDLLIAPKIEEDPDDSKKVG